MTKTEFNFSIVQTDNGVSYVKIFQVLVARKKGEKLCVLYSFFDRVKAEERLKSLECDYPYTFISEELVFF